MEAKLELCKFNFSQDAHCCSDADIEFEEIEIQYMSDLGIDFSDGGFFVLKTQQWAIESEDDLKVLFDRIKQVIKKKDQI